MRRTTRKRSTLANRAIVASAALILGGGGLVAVNMNASAHDGSENRQGSGRTLNSGQQMSTIDCPEVANGLPDNVPDQARGEVDQELAAMDSQITDAYKQFADQREQIQQDPQLAQNAILNPLNDKRVASIDRIANALDRNGEAPQDMESLAQCTMKADNNDTNDGQGDQNGDGQDGGDQNGDGQNGDDQNGDGQQGDGQDGGDQQEGNGPEADDFVDITTVQPNDQQGGNGLAANGEGGSTGTFTTSCGTNENNLFNSDNLIAAPGVDNGAHHTHDYVGNQDNDAFSSDEDLENADTTCQNQGDKSTYYWPVLRQQDGQDEFDANELGGGADGNAGTILEANQAEIKFVGNQQSDVTAMPKFLRIITGDAKAFTNGDANENASWSCTGFEDRQLNDKYPICPEGSQVVRTANFQSCWDGQNIDSANHRDHMSFVQEDGSCANGFQAIPQLQIRLVYDAQPPAIQNGQLQNPFALDSFPEQLHKPITDHNDFINVFDEDLMNEMVQCINSGEECQ